MDCLHCGKEISSTNVCTCKVARRMRNWAIIHIETNGLRPEEGAEILKIVLIGQQSEILWNKMYKPTRLCTWDDAQKINKISPQMVSCCIPLNKEEVEKLNQKLTQFDFLITNQKSFVQQFLDSANIKTPEMHGINALFEHYLDENNMPYQNVSLKNCATFFGLSEIPEKMQKIEKAYTMWFCYQNLEKLESKDIVPYLNPKEFCANGVKYQSFMNDAQILDYLKCIGIAQLSDREIPRLYYDGRYMSNSTIDVFVIGLSLNEDKSTEFIVLAVKNRVIGIKEKLFIEMQQRNNTKKEESEELTFFDLL